MAVYEVFDLSDEKQIGINGLEEKKLKFLSEHNG